MRIRVGRRARSDRPDPDRSGHHMNSAETVRPRQSCLGSEFMAPSLPTLQPTARRAVVLRHEPEDPGMSAHFDLMLEPAGPADENVRDVPTWRCDLRPDRLAIGSEITATPIAPHRRWWLTRPLGEDIALRPPLGVARILARGEIQASADEPADRSRVRVRWSNDTRIVEFRIEGSRLRCLAPPPGASRHCSSGDASCC